VIQAADKAIAAKNIELSNCYKINDAIKDINGKQSKMIMDKDQELDAWYRNPFVMFSLGLVAGGVAIHLVK